MAFRQLVIAVDAMEWDLVRQWAEEGKLPALRSLMEEGASGELSTPAEQLPDTVWPSLLTGLNPARLEKYFYVQYDASIQGLRHVTDDAISAAPVWKILSEAGVRVGVADVAKFGARPCHGFQVANWGAHATAARKESFPPELWQQIQSRFGNHPVGDCDRVDDRFTALRDLRERVLRGVRMHGDLFRWLMQTQPWDVLFAGFSEAHCIGHHFWRFADEKHPRHTSAGGLDGAIEDVYRALDREIGEMVALAGEGVRVFVVSGHGMGPIFHASWNLSEILGRLGYGSKTPVRKGSVNPWRMLKMILPGRMQYAIRDALPAALRDQLLYLWYAGDRKWRGCRAFPVPNNDSVGAIRIAVKGRDKYGLVEPGGEYDRVCKDIADALRELTDPQTGRPVVKRVTLTHEKFSGPFLHQLPDITVLWDQTFPWSALSSPRFGTLTVRRQDSRSGSHTPHGFVVMRGPGIEGGTVVGHSVYDIAPTILEGAGVTVPDGLDGKSMVRQGKAERSLQPR
jgi:predicted AlkP superfamily phosphohydrolase/phosphomutase